MEFMTVIFLAYFISFKDLFITPIYIGFIYLIANYFVKKNHKEKVLRKYFKQALIFRIFAVIAFTLIHEFLYGGDTGNYFLRGSTFIWEAFLENPLLGLKLIFNPTNSDPATLKYTGRMIWGLNGPEGLVIRISAFLGLFTFNTYIIISFFISLFTLSGLWASFLVLYNRYPTLHKQLAIAFLFIPSVVFWSSGLLKDPLTMGALGWLFWGLNQTFIKKTKIFKGLVVSALSAFLIMQIKVYILLSFAPPALFWIMNENSTQIKNTFVRLLLKPLFLIVGAFLAFTFGSKLTEGDEKYDIDNFAERSQINAYYLSKQVASGSAYDIGTIDGSVSSMIKVAPQAIVVAIYRPFLWEVRSPMMLISALEASAFIFLTLQFLFKTGFFNTIRLISSKPILSFFIIFSLIFAFGVGTNSGNFGTLVRYKIPLMPFYLAAIFIMQGYANKPKKLPRLATTA